MILCAVQDLHDVFFFRRRRRRWPITTGKAVSTKRTSFCMSESEKPRACNGLGCVCVALPLICW